MATMNVRVWDLPVRLFHWLLVAAMAGAVVTGQIGGNLIIWHGRLGIAILGLVGFRLVWGLLGSRTARFSSFVRGPGAIRAYLKGQWHGIGHNPLGALSVLALLGLLAVQGTTGLFANDDIAFSGPLRALVSEALSGRITGIHEAVGNLLIALVSLHVAAIVFYVRVKRENLVKPMLSGWKEVESDSPVDSTQGGGPVAFIIALAVALGVVWVALGSWIPQPPPPPPTQQSAPAW